MKHWKSSEAGHDHSAGVVQASKAPGKRPSTIQRYGGAAPRAPVQPRGAGGDADAVKDAAAKGVSGSGGALPHMETIQRAFGHHDVSGVRAHVGSDAAAACDSMGGALGYASGSDIALKDTSLETVAHEAAHTVQQRQGVQLQDGVGATGDAYERHADEVARAVVSGQSAESLLDQGAGGGGSAGVQARMVQRNDPPTPAPPQGGIPADIAGWTRAQCIEVATAMYIGGPSSVPGENWTNRGILDHKIDAVTLMVGDLYRSDPQSIGQRILKSVLTIGVAAGAAALAVGTGPLAAALIAGGAAVISEVPNYFQDSGPPVDPTDFGDKYLSSLRTGWPRSVAQMTARMSTDESARQVCAQTRALANNPSQVKQIQRNELLDEWMNALNQKQHGDSREGIGSENLGTASTGRLHLWQGYIANNLEFRKPTSARMEGVSLEKLRHMNLDRKIGDIKCTRTMYVMTSWGATALALGPNDAAWIQYEGMSQNRARGVMASYALGRELDANDMGWFEGGHDQAIIDQHWAAGVNKAWDQLKPLTLRQLGVQTIGS